MCQCPCLTQALVSDWCKLGLTEPSRCGLERTTSVTPSQPKRAACLARWLQATCVVRKGYCTCKPEHDDNPQPRHASELAAFARYAEGAGLRGGLWELHTWQPLRDEFGCLFQHPMSMRQFMWQPNTVRLAKYVVACMRKLNTGTDA